MNLLDALTEPWVVSPSALKTMLEIYERHGASADLDRIKAASAPFSNKARPYQVIDGVAVLDVVGVLGKRFDLFTQICGGASTQRLQEELAQALSDSAVHSILLNVDSPGGEVDGVQALADDVFNARKSGKPVYALIDGLGASGAYWIASAAEKVFLASDTTMAGSIGVVYAHKDVSGAEEKRGVKTTEVTAGKYKRIASNYAPLSEEGYMSLKEIVDHIYGVFVQSVARNRGVSADVVEKDMADGRVFLGDRAIKAGLADGFSKFESLIGKLNDQNGAASASAAIAAIQRLQRKSATEAKPTEENFSTTSRGGQVTMNQQKAKKEPDVMEVARLAKKRLRERHAEGDTGYTVSMAVRDVRVEVFGLSPYGDIDLGV